MNSEAVQIIKIAELQSELIRFLELHLGMTDARNVSGIIGELMDRKIQLAKQSII